MGRHVPGGFSHYLRNLARTLRDDPRSDTELLAAFTGGDQAAFTALVVRHAPCVWGACRRVLGDDADAQDAEDAFQAAFIALARQSRIETPTSVARWLARVARRVSLNVRTASHRRDAAHRRLYERAAPRPDSQPADEETRTAVREELAGLPERLRVPLALYYLEGKTQAETGQLLGISEQAVAQRLRRGLDALRGQLVRRGMAVTTASLAAFLCGVPVAAAVPPALIATAAEAAVEAAEGGPAVTTAAQLAQDVISSPGWSRLGLYGLVVAVVTGVACGAALCLQPASPVRPEPAGPVAATAPPVVPAVRADRFGDPLPDGAAVRIGTTRLRPSQYHGDASVAFSLDGKTLYTVDGRDAVRVWDIATGRELRVLTGPRNCLGVAISPDGHLLVAGGATDVWAWELEPEGPRLLWKQTPKGLGYWCIAFAPNGQTLACGGDNERAIHLLNAANGELVKTLPGRGYKLAFSHDGQTLASWNRGVPPHEVCVWDIATGKKRHTLTCGKDENAPVASFAFSTDDRTLATASRDGVIRIWDLATGREKILTDAAGRNAFIAFEPGGRVLVEAGSRRIRFWDPATGKEVRAAVEAPDLHPELTHDACRLSQDGRLFASATAAAIGVWDVRTGKPVGPAGVPMGPVISIAFSPDGRDLGLKAWVGELLSTTQLYDTQTGQLQGEFRVGERDKCLTFLSTPVVVTAQSEILVTGVRASLEPSPGSINSICFSWKQGKSDPVVETVLAGTGVGFPPCPMLSPDGRLLASKQAGSVVLTERANGKELCAIKPAGEVTQLAFATDGGTLGCWLQTPKSATVSVWDSRTGGKKNQWTIETNRNGYVPPLTLSSDGRRLAVGTNAVVVERGSVQVWNVEAGELMWEATLPTNPAGAVAFSPDGRSLATGGVDGVVRVWETYSGQERFRRAGHKSVVLALAFSPDGARLASGSADATALIWDARPRRATTAVPGLDTLWAALTSRDGAAAYDAILTLADSPATAVPLLRERLTPPPLPSEQVKQWIADLSNDEFNVREAATRELARRAEAVEPALRAALKAEPSAEATARLRELLRKLGPLSAQKLGIVRGIEALERMRGDPAAHKLLRELAEAPADNLLGQEARAACSRLLAEKTPARAP